MWVDQGRDPADHPNTTKGEQRMAAVMTQLYRYPVKGLSADPLDRVPLTVGRCLPQDRRFAIALGSTRFDPAQPQWLAKTNFIMLMRDEKLACLSTRFDPGSGLLTIAERGNVLLEASLTDPGGSRTVARFFEDFLGKAVIRPLRLVEAPGHAFADARRAPNASTGQYVSLINLESVYDLEGKLGTAIDPIRFRANVYFSGLPAWAEQEWVKPEHVLAIGAVRLRVVAPITRCAATEVNPQTAKRDVAMVAELMRHYGHNIMGVYAEVVTAGEIGIGDQIANG
jgi:uncharacterized protein